ncbi:hypothetical protein GIB67_039335 [Kingdonia uniflora]|uniref:Uncharacterized protein n=1 Tax=Kingdonia uniflora TaxID=39325 RepID=A0A7J7LX74_9MAGN|nr:hypothetical protein GIB67_039335 [Kingdonia uniflora]
MMVALSRYTRLNPTNSRREGIPSVGMSPFASGWSTCERSIACADVSQVARVLDSGFIPMTMLLDKLLLPEAEYEVHLASQLWLGENRGRRGKWYKS